MSVTFIVSSSPDLVSRNTDQLTTLVIQVVGVVAAIVVLCIILAVFTRRRNNSKRSNGQQKIKEGGRWNRLNPFKSKTSRYQAAMDEDSAELNSTSANTRNDVAQANSNQTNRNSNTAGATVDRNTSVRSVLTLPAYSRAASNTEQVIGREGDRDGVDVVVEFPTEQDEEALREQEMDALYQLRATRRQQNAEREELRRQRREAQRRNDYTTLTELRNRARAASNSNQSLVDELRRDIDRAKENRQRSTSSVSYADLGVARHDGTRIRANSQESERMGLLSDAANMGHHPRSGANSPNPQGRPRSTSDISADSDFPSPGLTRTRGDSQPGTPRISIHGGRAGSSPELVESDLGVEAMPPPEYEDVPLDDNDETLRSTTPMHEPPPDYPGPYRSDSQRSRRSQFEREQAEDQNQPTVQPEGEQTHRGRGVGGVPQLPSLRIGRLPSIVIEPSSAHPREDDIEEERGSTERR